ncbi:glycine--tRNA ligase [Candidatus Peregrinibacteria bacterium CG_4_10_14_0_2_um_filter_41_8]|nr:MAG: glycine--tRNA ligase [Candidatus Peregrinibacteria bacterium CG_4_10_14_0_2_um_filter_41_8]
MSQEQMEKIVALAKRRGFVYPGAEIYGGLANSWDYGPMGAQLRKNIKDSWWRTFVEEREDMVGLDGAILMNPKVWEASGHLTTFNDPLVEDKITHKRYRADHLIEEVLGESTTGMTIEAMGELIKERNLKSPEGNELTEPKHFNLMFNTFIGPVDSEAEKVYLRPETAQSIFVNFKNVIDTTRMRVPFGIAQIGKAFRNEITPGNFIFRTLEFEQMEIEYFIEEDKWEELFETWLTSMKNWAVQIGLDADKLTDLEVSKEELAHYSKRTIDLEYEFPFGVKELWGLAYRTNFDLASHQEHSGETLTYTDPQDNKRKYLPHVLEPTFGVDRTLLALLVTAYEEEELEGGDVRIVLRFKPEIAPVQVAIFPLMKKDELMSLSGSIYQNLKKMFRTDFDEGGSIGKRYRRYDEIGTPYCITVDFDSLEDSSVTVRERDSMTQERVNISDLGKWLGSRINQ